MNTPPLPPRPRVLGLVSAIVLAMIALPAPAAAHAVGDEPPPVADPDPPVVELVVPEEPTSITLIVPPLPVKKPSAAKPVVKSGAAAATRVASDPTPAPARSYTPEPEPAYSPSPDTEPEPTVAAAEPRKAKPKARAKPTRRSKRKPAATRRPAEAASAAVPRPIVDQRHMLVSALPRSSYAPIGDHPGPPYLLLLLAVGGTLLLGLAGAAPRLAPHWPEVFVPLTRERDVVSFFGLCLLASGMLAWAIVGSGV